MDVAPHIRFRLSSRVDRLPEAMRQNSFQNDARFGLARQHRWPGDPVALLSSAMLTVRRHCVYGAVDR